MKKIFTLFLASIALACASANFPFDVKKIFTQEDREEAMKQIADADRPMEWKLTHSSYVHCGSLFTEKELPTISYQSFKTRAKNIEPRAYDMFIYMFFNKRADILGAYLADTTYGDYDVFLRKFYIIPSLNACAKVDPDVYVDVVLKAFSNPKCEPIVKTYKDKEQKTVRTFIAKTRIFQREKALQKLKDLKRLIYKYIMQGDDWKAVIDELDLEIKALS